jgi:hypothetical protein
MVANIPPKLYKFQSFDSDKSIENLRCSQIWFSKPELLNDPFDCSININFYSTEEEIVNFVRDYYIPWLRESGHSEEIAERELQYLPNGKPSKELIEKTEKVLREKNQQRRYEFSQMGVACFTTEVENVLMWSHYACRHKGFCLEFDTNYFLFDGKLNLNPVDYSNSFPTYPHVDIVQNPLIVNSPLTTKSKDWKYEKEWRLIVKEGNSALEYDAKALTAIYFGCWASKENMEKIATLPAKSAARLYQMQRSETEFKLDYVPYRMS